MILQLPVEIETAMVTHAYACHPNESCGLLAGDDDGRLRLVIATTNVLSSHTNYTIEPREHFKALRYAESRGWDIIGVFHSHPHTEGYPSSTDIRLAPDPTWIYFLVGMEDIHRPEVRAFSIIDGNVEEKDLDRQLPRETLATAPDHPTGAHT